MDGRYARTTTIKKQYSFICLFVYMCRSWQRPAIVILLRLSLIVCLFTRHHKTGSHARRRVAQGVEAALLA